jgi:hypothetical protein
MELEGLFNDELQRPKGIFCESSLWTLKQHFFLQSILPICASKIYTWVFNFKLKPIFTTVQNTFKFDTQYKDSQK